MNTVIVAALALSLSAAQPVGPKACAHRGDAKCAPENTIPAFTSAVRKGAHMIEFDVALSKDGKAIIIHDPTLDRTTNGTGKVESLTFDELRALDAGSWFDKRFAGTQMPTLEETLKVIPKTVWCNVHLKNYPGVAESAARTIKAMGRQDHCFLACKVKQAEAAKAIFPEIKICNMDRQSGNRPKYVQNTIDMKAEFIQLLGDEKGLAEDVKRSQDHGVKVNYFGASEATKIKRIAQAGAEYILTDDLDTCLEVLREELGVAPVKHKK